MFGRNVMGQTGQPVLLSYDGRPEWKAGGVTVDWSTVAAIASTPLTTSPEGFVVPVGSKWMRFGQVLTKITNATTITITITGTPTGGSITYTGTRPDTQATSTVTIPYNASVATTQGFMDTVYGAGNTVVSGAGALPGNVQTVTAAGSLLHTTLPAPSSSGTGLTGGTSPAVAAVIANAGANTGMFGPFDPSVSDGRQTLALGDVYLLNESVFKGGVLGLGTLNADQLGVVAGGRVWKSRILSTGVATHTLAGGPTLAELLAVMPRLVLVGN